MTTLERLLDDNARLAHSHRGTINHLPMALTALAAMGAPDQRLEDYFAWWEENRALPREGAEPAVTRATWRDFLGQSQAFAPLGDLFAQWMEEVGQDAVVLAVAPHLLAAPGAAAFHAIIRLACGFASGNQHEAAAGLASWASTFRPLGLEAASRPAPVSMTATLAAVAASVAGKPRPRGLITTGMIQVAQDADFRAALTAPPGSGEALIGAMAHAAIRLYWALPNFTILHLVTGTHAARIVAERYPALLTPAFEAALWGDWCAAYATVGGPALEDAPVRPDLPDWPVMFAAAVAQNDDHVIKLTWSCREEEARWGDALYRQAAARMVGL
jgi:hypothetical protein